MTKELFIDRYQAEYWKSRTGATVMKLSKLCDAKYRRETGLYLAEGIKLTEEALRHSHVQTVVVSEEALTGANTGAILTLTDGAKNAGCAIALASAEAFSKISTENAPQGILAVLPVPERCVPIFAENGRYLLLDTIQDPGNLGTILRSASAFGVTGVVTCGCADLTSPKTVRASMGAVFRVSVWSVESLADAVQTLRGKHRVLAAALSENCLCVGQTPLMPNDCVVIGNEGHGIAPEIIAACSDVIRIPMTGETESLNASIAASILLWEYMRTFPQT